MTDNKQGSNTWLIALLAGVGAGLVFGFFFGLIVGLLLAIIAGGVAYAVANAQNKSGSQQKSTPETQQGPTLDDVLSQLAELNLKTRLAGIEKEPLNAIEMTIDQLLELLPRVEHELEEGELKWVVYRIATDYLPKRAVEPYLLLQENERREAKAIENLISGQTAMQSELKEINALLDKKNSAEFQSKATFLKHRFNF